ncbi:hypothetical protein Q0P04_14185, partial [Staphylococcus aureus]|nr:hypothetical protein [Staphylococcus aureus]
SSALGSDEAGFVTFAIDGESVVAHTYQPKATFTEGEYDMIGLTTTKVSPADSGSLTYTPYDWDTYADIPPAWLSETVADLDPNAYG